MKKLSEKSPIWHAVIWIVIYVALIPIGDWLSEAFGRENSATSVATLALAVVLIVYVNVNGRRKYYGIRGISRQDTTRGLLFLPLLVMALLQFVKPVRADLDFFAVLLIILLMIGVGFVEELIFRGFLFRAILKKGTLARAVIISGVTFGIGHVMNLALGYTGPEQIIQVVMAISIGISLALLFAVTGSIMPGVVFHILLNISGSATETDEQIEWIVASVILLISVAYSVYLTMVLRKHGRSRALTGASAAA